LAILLGGAGVSGVEIMAARPPPAREPRPRGRGVWCDRLPDSGGHGGNRRAGNASIPPVQRVSDRPNGRRPEPARPARRTHRMVPDDAGAGIHAVRGGGRWADAASGTDSRWEPEPESRSRIRRSSPAVRPIAIGRGASQVGLADGRVARQLLDQIALERVTHQQTRPLSSLAGAHAAHPLMRPTQGCGCIRDRRAA
jgi:hypothetical protein